MAQGNEAFMRKGTYGCFLLAIGENPRAFWIGWCAGITGFILGYALIKIIF
jgi:hypothetical protein